MDKRYRYGDIFFIYYLFISVNWAIVLFYMIKLATFTLNSRGGWNKCGGGAKSINVEGGIFWKKLVHKCNKRGVEGGKNL